MDKKVWAIWKEGQTDPEYARLYQEMFELERKYEDVVCQLDCKAQDVIRDYVIQCEAMSWRMLELACEQMEARS